jgi:hypothetical protein
MSGPGEGAPLIPHEPPKPYPLTSLVGVAVPTDFNKVIIAAAAKNDLVYQDQLLTWAMKGAEHERLCEPKTAKSGRKNRK